jgi:phosphatidate cytidylyltransferase
MSPHAALHDLIFLRYVVIVGSLLLLAGLILGLLLVVFRKRLEAVWTTYLSWLWLVPLVAFFIFAGRAIFLAGLTVIAVLGFREFARATRMNRDRWVMSTIYLALLGCGIALLLQVPSVLILLFAIIALAANGAVRSLSLGAIALVFFAGMLGRIGSLANSDHAYGYLCFLFLATELNDVAAFVCGRIFGRHPLLPRVSPHKTWEGSLGALAFSLLLPWLLRFSFPFFGTRQLILTGLAIGVGGQLGDLTFSALKRMLGIKDWSCAIPGHGGILDRIDSLVFTAPLFSLLA